MRTYNVKNEIIFEDVGRADETYGRILVKEDFLNGNEVLFDFLIDRMMYFASTLNAECQMNDFIILF